MPPPNTKIGIACPRHPTVQLGEPVPALKGVVTDAHVHLELGVVLTCPTGGEQWRVSGTLTLEAL